MRTAHTVAQVRAAEEPLLAAGVPLMARAATGLALAVARRLPFVYGARVVLPEYFRLQNDGKKTQWIVAKPTEVPAASGLAKQKFDRPKEKPPEPYDTPEAAESSFKKPGPVAGPFKAHLGDGSVVTYYWYRFADQPALLNADLTKDEREKMQAKVEKMHRAWTKDRVALPD